MVLVVRMPLLFVLYLYKSSIDNECTNVHPCVPRLPLYRDAWYSQLLAPLVRAVIDISTISYCSPALSQPEEWCAAISCVRCVVPSTKSSLLSIVAPSFNLAQRRLSMSVRSKQGALGSPRRAGHPISICMPSATVDDRCVTVVSARGGV